MSLRDKRLRRISRQLQHFTLHDLGDDPPLDAATIVAELEGRQATPLFLNYYTARGLTQALKRYGLWQEVAARGYAPQLAIERLDDRDALKIRDQGSGELLIELVAHLVPLALSDPAISLPGPAHVDLLVVEWLLMQDPRAQFGDRLPFPGQDHPGLGVGRTVMTLLEIMAGRLRQEGLLAFPEHFHNALLYDERFRFLSPVREGELRALARDLQPLGLSLASWAIDRGLVRDEAGVVVRWRGGEMLRPLSPRLCAYVAGSGYRRAVSSRVRACRYRWDEAAVADLAERLRRRARRSSP